MFLFTGIVHRDLKSMNLLLDSKWNVKVSDFGLTQFKEQLKKEGEDGGGRPASIHWTAPEVLNESPNINFEAADVCFSPPPPPPPPPPSFLPCRPAAVAVAVLRDNLRPVIPEEAPPDYTSLITNCWDRDPTVRPHFLEILTRLEAMVNEKSTLSSSSMASWNMSTSSTGGGSASSHSSGVSEGKGSFALPCPAFPIRNVLNSLNSSNRQVWYGRQGAYWPDRNRLHGHPPCTPALGFQPGGNERCHHLEQQSFAR